MTLLGIIGIWQIILLAFFLSLLLLPVWAIVVMLKNEHEPNNRLLWIVLIILLPIIGSVVYLILRGNTRNRSNYQR